MNPLLIICFGISINADKRTLIITNGLKGTRLAFYPHKINHDGIIIDGHTGNMTFEAMRWLSKHNRYGDIVKRFNSVPTWNTKELNESCKSS